jgi:hypothetical protein
MGAALGDEELRGGAGWLAEQDGAGGGEGLHCGTIAAVADFGRLGMRGDG